jgi:hypothetical protein
MFMCLQGVLVVSVASTAAFFTKRKSLE